MGNCILAVPLANSANGAGANVRAITIGGTLVRGGITYCTLPIKE